MSTEDLDSQEKKALIKEALQEWLDKQFAAVGRWTIRGAGSILLVGLAYLWLTSHGWHQ